MAAGFQGVVVRYFVALIIVYSSKRIMAWRKFETCGMIPKSYFDEQKSVYGLVERVIDGDTIRVRHLPLYSWRLWGKQPVPLEQRGISQETISIRLYGIDCPELAKRGQKPQSGSVEAKQYVKELIEHRAVRITFLRKDQYNRAVAAVELLPRWGPCFKWIPFLGRRDLTIILAKEGLAELYTSGGAEYWGKRDQLKQYIGEAQKQRRGIWAEEGRVSAAEYKKRFKNIQPTMTAVPRGGAAETKKGPATANLSKKTETFLSTALTGLEFIA